MLQSCKLWRATCGFVEHFGELGVGPNPFNSTLHINSKEELDVRLMDLTGRTLLQHTGSAEDINKQLDAKVVHLATGNYLLHANSVSGKKQVFKISKQ